MFSNFSQKTVLDVLDLLDLLDEFQECFCHCFDFSIPTFTFPVRS